MSCNAIDEFIFTSLMMSKRRPFTLTSISKITENRLEPGQVIREDGREQSCDFLHKTSELFKLSEQVYELLHYNPVTNTGTPYFQIKNHEK